ncbi:ClbS/DfsB family four-helix bundle protein [Bacillus sp. SD088]|uniref:ClbS/DfsB family four-helix bundle protein n=1 Tax=Bacillus sp. SD088 TaxID=2782012 RepID=UPI001A9717BC|nr:ClbS/DfsB family four-helix bundle protein [Bacillus sp. SD088]MBO0995187.1 ClbS/DfsB family four-helix bundle protein [Bacillus sp. SD088]
MISKFTFNLGTEDCDSVEDFYTSKLGFQVVQKFSDDVGTTWLLLSTGEVDISFYRVNQQELPTNLPILNYINTDQILELYKSLRKDEVKVKPLRLTFHKTIEFDTTDPAGYSLCFAQETKKMHMNHHELLSLIDETYQELISLVHSISSNKREQGGVIGLWSIKDVVSHLGAWEKRLISWIEEAKKGEVAITPEPGYNWSQINQMNADTYQKLKDLSWEAVVDDFEKTHQKVETLIKNMSLEELNDPTYYKFTNGQPLWVDFGFNTFDHFRHHLQPIYDWLCSH